jgi:hypothetical protein
MTDTQDKPNAPDNAQRLDELITTIRAALASDAGTDVRSAGAIACRAILGALDPTSRPAPGVSPTPPSSAAASPQSSPIAALLGAIGQIPREQLLQVIGGLRWFLGQQGPTYLPRPMPPTRSPGASGGGS